MKARTLLALPLIIALAGCGKGEESTAPVDRAALQSTPGPTGQPLTTQPGVQGADAEQQRAIADEERASLSGR